MGAINPDMSDVVRIAPGTYFVRITDSKVVQTRKDQARVMWKLTIFGAEDARVNDKIITHGTMAEGPGAGFLQDFYKAATGVAWVDGCLSDTDDLHGRELRGVVVDQLDQNNEKTGFPEVKKYLSYESQPVVEASA